MFKSPLSACCTERGTTKAYWTSTVSGLSLHQRLDATQWTICRAGQNRLQSQPALGSRPAMSQRVRGQPGRNPGGGKGGRAVQDQRDAGQAACKNHPQDRGDVGAALG